MAEAVKKEHNVEWNQLEKALAAFEQFLHKANAHAKISDWHVVFSLGSVVRLSPEQIAKTQQFTGYDGEYIANFPTHRLQDENILPEIIEQNTTVWERQRDHLNDDTGRALRMGYELLTKDGYPFPGGEGADRMPIPMGEVPGEENYLWSIIWTHRTKDIVNLAISDNPMTAVGSGGELRRYDVMFPKVAAVISPDLVITRVA